MEKMREFMQSTMGKVVLLIVLAPMAFLGVQSFSGSGAISDNEMVKVGDSSISTAEYDNELRATRQELLTRVDASLINDQILADEVLQSMIDRALLEDQAHLLGMTVSDEAITRLLRQDSTFHDANGQFSDELFGNYLRSRGMNKEMLFDAFRTQLSLRQLSMGILGTAIYPNAKISQLIDLQLQNRDVWVVRYPWQKYADKVTISQADIERYYNEHKDTMTRPAVVDLAYIQLSADALKVEAPTESELRQAYDAIADNGEVVLAQILLTGANAQTRATEIKAKIDAGESFEALAKAHSDDPSGQDGGKIGTFNPSVFGADANAVQKAIGSLSTGQVSTPIKTSYGYQIFKVLKKASKPSFESMKAELAKQVGAQKRANAYGDMIAKINGMALDGMGISDIAKETGLTANVIKNYPKQNNTTELSAPVIIATAFDQSLIDDQAVSPNIDLGNRSLWVQPSNYQVAKNLSASEAAEVIRPKLVEQKAIELALKAASEDATGDIANLKAKAEALGLVNIQSDKLGAAEQSSLFTTKPTQTAAWAIPTDIGATLMVANPVVMASQSSLSAGERLMASSMIRANLGEDQFQDYLQYLKDTKKVQVNDRARQSH